MFPTRCIDRVITSVYIWVIFQFIQIIDYVDGMQEQNKWLIINFFPVHFCFTDQSLHSI